MTRRMLLALCASPLAAQQGGRRDDAFSGIPFERWLNQSAEAGVKTGEAVRVRWNSRVSEPQLSTYQRLIVSITAEIDGAELARRRGKGRLLLLAQVTDETGGVWQNHLDVDLSHIEEGMKTNNVDFTLFFFVLPGDYQVTLAVYDDATAEHSVRRHRLHVNPLKNDPLPHAWDGLPRVEFIPVLDPPEKWYLPMIEGRLNLTASAREPVHIDLIVNLTPSGHQAGSTQVQNRIFEVLLPAAKVFSQVDWRDASFGMTFIDLARNRVVYQQEDRRPVDWSRAGESLKEINAGTIDARALEQRQRTANFFVSEIRRRIRSAGSRRTGGPPVVIVLSSAFRFIEPQTFQPVNHDEPYTAKVFYIRYQPAPQLFVPRIMGGDGTLPAIRADHAIEDQLAPLLKPLEPRLFEVSTGDNLRKALSGILGEIAML